MQNAQNATKTAQGSMANLIASNPGPFAGQSIKQPGVMNGAPQTPGNGMKTIQAPNPVAPASPPTQAPGATGTAPTTTGAGVGMANHMNGAPQTGAGNSLINRILQVAA